MASVKKFSASAVANLLRHNERETSNPSNKDIDLTLSSSNYSLIHHNGLTDFEYYKQRKSELYCINRKDVKVLCGWVVTAPKDLPLGEYSAFFQATHNFLCERYGFENCVQSIVHNDEKGQPHLHFCFIPAVEDLKHGGEKICAHDLITRQELKRFHGDLQQYLDAQGLHAHVKTGITKAQGGNRTVRELKKERSIEQLREREQTQSRWRTGSDEREREISRWQA